MAFSLIASVGAGSTNGNNVTTAGITTTGANLIIIGVASYSVNTIETVSDSKSNTWTRLTIYTEGTGGGAGARHTLYYCLAPTVGTGHTFTASGTTIFPSINVVAFSGAKVTAVFDVENGAAGFVYQPGSVTPSQNNSLIVTGIHSWQSSIPNTINSGFTVSTTQNYIGGQRFGAGLAYLIQSTAAAVNPTWTSNNPTAHDAVGIAVFKPEPVATTGNSNFFLFM